MTSKNWDILVEKCEDNIGKTYLDYMGVEYLFVGLLHSDDDYYYLMRSFSGKYKLLSCVGSLYQHNYTLAVTVN